MILRRVWPRWRDALMLIQPATIDRWHRDGFYRCWRRRLRRPGRPRIDSQCRGLIRQLAGENRLWGAPRIHGELLKLGIAVSERTVSRYLRDRLRAPSQTRSTFIANHLGQFTFISPATSPYAPSADDVVDLSGLMFRTVPFQPYGLSASHQCALADWRASLQRTSPHQPIARDHHRRRTAVRNGCGRGPPTHGPLRPNHGVARRVVSCSLHRTSAPNASVRPSVTGQSSPSLSTSSANETASFGRARMRSDSHGRRNMGEAQDLGDSIAKRIGRSRFIKAREPF
jgi:hypothetical protein